MVSNGDTEPGVSLFMLIDMLLGVSVGEMVVPSTPGRFPGARPGEGLGGC